MPKYPGCPITGTHVHVPDPYFIFIRKNKGKNNILNYKPRGPQVPVRGVRKHGLK